MDFEYRDKHGRKVSQDQRMKGVETAAVEEAQKSLEDVIRSIRCPTHGAAVTSLTARSGSGGVQFQWSGCCEELNDAVERALR